MPDGTRVAVNQQMINIFVYGNGSADYHLGIGFFMHKGITGFISS
jgi:hypothetical protein